MAEKQLLLHELLEEEQEPFRLKSYIADRRFKLKKSSPITALQRGKQKPAVAESGNFCLFWFNKSPDVRNSPLSDAQSPVMNPCNSPISPVFLHVPSRTAVLLVEAAMKILKQQQPKQKARIQILGFGLFSSLVKRLRDRAKNKKHDIDSRGFKIRANCWKNECSLSPLTGVDPAASAGHCMCKESEEINCQFTVQETLFCPTPVSPFRFCLHKNPSSSGLRTPNFQSPVASPSRLVKQRNAASSKISNSGIAQDDHEEEKEHCSPVSVLDLFIEDEGLESGEAEGEHDELNSNYMNVQRVKQQLLYRLRRFERLAELDPMELEKRLMEGNSDDECCNAKSSEPKGDDKFSPFRVQDIDNEVFILSSLQCSFSRQASNSRVEDKSKMISTCSKKVVWGRICKRLESFKECESIYTAIDQDFKNDHGSWKNFSQQVEATASEVELAIIGLFTDELLEELCL